MTKPDSSLIAVVMDRSGSMEDICDITIKGFNEFLKNQKEQPGDCVMYYTHFDHEYNIVHSYVPLANMPELTTETYQPRGNTALLDAVGRTIRQVGQDLAARSEDERPSNIVFVIQTDGMENASHEYTRQQVFDLISEHRDLWKWNFLFLGASQDSMQEAQSMGIASGQSLNYSGQNTKVAYAAASSNVSHARRSGSTRTFTQKERDESK